MSVCNVCIKVKPVSSLAEAHALRFIGQHTSIPVPKIHYAFVHKRSTYIVMSKMKGKMVWHGWKSRSVESRAKILSQLREMVAQLRAVPPPEGTCVGAVDGGPFCDCRLPGTFHEALATGANLDVEHANLPAELSGLFGFYRQSSNQLVLTHGDLSSLNVLVEGDQVTGVVDWETAGWLPWYWEYTCAKNAHPQNAFWADEVDGFIEPMPYELKMEALRLKYFGAV